MSDFESRFADELDRISSEYFDRERFVPGVGPADADVVLVGEAPGESEVAEGEPFVGRAGSRLDEALESLGVERSSLYVTNLVKVRPPENRTPYVDEIAAWRDVLDAELASVSPAVVVPLGTTATRVLLDTDEGVTAVHGRRFERDEWVVVPAFHPAATLYDRSKLGDFEADLRTAFESV